MSDGKKKSFRDEEVRSVYLNDFKIEELEDDVKKLLKEYFIFQMRKLGYLALALNDMKSGVSRSKATTNLSGLMTSENLPLETIDSWVEVQQFRNKIIYLERGISKDEFLDSVRQSVSIGISIGGNIVKEIRDEQ